MPTTTCRHEIDWLLHRKADGRLSGDETVALERQLAACPACRERAALLEWAGGSLQQGQKAVPPGFADRVMRLAAQRPLQRVRHERPRTTALRWLPAAAAAAALVAVVLVGQRLTRQAPVAAPEVQVELQFVGGAAGSVAVAGDFNGWDAAEMRRGEDGVWRIRLSLPPGRYQYAFVVDKKTWLADPRAATLVDSGYGGADSVLDVSL